MRTWREEVLTRLEALNTALGGTAIELSNPANFEADSLTLLSACALAAAAGAGSGTNGSAGAGGSTPESSTPPTNPSDGDRWREIDGNGYPVEEWFWHSSESEWWSSKVYETSGFPGVRLNYASSVSFGNFVAVRSVVLLGLQLRYRTIHNSDTQNYFRFSFEAYQTLPNLQGVLTTFLTVDTRGDAAGLYSVEVPLANYKPDPSTLAIRTVHRRYGAANNWSHNATADFKYRRIRSPLTTYTPN